MDSGEAGCGARVCSAGPGARKNLKAIGMDPERIRNVMSEVVGLWRRVESLGGCKLGTFSYSASKKVQSSEPRGAQESGVMQDTMEFTKGTAEFRQ